ncbi:MAG: thioredoxin domain-containing protein [Pseudooceanicola sp.]|nr:thioredoxin domain-containing protein [Pseudooceanicola sp.]
MFRALRQFSLPGWTLAAPLVALLASPAPAFDLAQMTDAEREAFRAEVRAYLLENPEVLMEAIDVLQNRQQEQQVSADKTLVSDNADALFEDGRSWVGGNPQGDVTLVEFMDYRCGYCRKAFPEVDELLRADGNIRYIVKEFPILGDQSVMASRFAIAVRNTAGDAAYEAVHNALMTMRAEVSETALRHLAQTQGLDVETVMAAMSAPEVNDELNANMALAQALQINGTPGFVFGDQLVRGYVPLDAMVQLIGALRS